MNRLMPAWAAALGVIFWGLPLSAQAGDLKQSECNLPYTRWVFGKCVCTTEARKVTSKTDDCTYPAPLSVPDVVRAIQEIAVGKEAQKQACALDNSPSAVKAKSLPNRLCTHPSDYVCDGRVNPSSGLRAVYEMKLSDLQGDEAKTDPQFLDFLKKNGISSATPCKALKSESLRQECRSILSGLLARAVLTPERKSKASAVFEKAKSAMKQYLGKAQDALEHRKPKSIAASKAASKLGKFKECLDQASLEFDSDGLQQSSLYAEGELCTKTAKVHVSYQALLAESHPEALLMNMLHEISHLFTAKAIQNPDPEALGGNPFRPLSPCILQSTHDLHPAGWSDPHSLFYTEAYADVIGSGAYWEAAGSAPSNNADGSAVSNAVAFFCSTQAGTGHESGENRINRFLLSHPFARATLGCAPEPASPGGYCGVEALEP